MGIDGYRFKNIDGTTETNNGPYKSQFDRYCFGMKIRHKYRASEIFQDATGAKQPKISQKIVAGSKCFNCNYCEALDKRFWREELMVLENDRPRRQNVPVLMLKNA